MADHNPARDLSLLERLNALKPSSISLTGPPSSISSSGNQSEAVAKRFIRSEAASTIERAKPPSKEDALTARLKSLRDRGPDSPDSTVTGQHGDRESMKSTPIEKPGFSTESKLSNQQHSTSVPVIDDVDQFLNTDDETLEELLEDLRSDESWLQEMTAEEEHRRVTALLTELRESPSEDADLDKQNGHEHASPEDGEDSSSDDSDGEVMATEIDSVLAKTIDEIEWEKSNQPPSPSPQSVPTPPSQPQRSNHISQGSQAEDPFNLPTVPSELHEQPDLPAPSAHNQAYADFEASIAQRMAALKLSGAQTLPSAPDAPFDSLGLPQAPTSALVARPASVLTPRTGLTDEDQKTWCVVCLEDGTVHCLGCEAGDDVYCGRCWKEMHVGPQAGYEERGHSYEAFRLKPR